MTVQSAIFIRSAYVVLRKDKEFILYVTSGNIHLEDQETYGGLILNVSYGQL
jgi:hypothetical protein